MFLQTHHNTPRLCLAKGTPHHCRQSAAMSDASAPPEGRRENRKTHDMIADVRNSKPAEIDPSILRFVQYIAVDLLDLFLHVLGRHLSARAHYGQREMSCTCSFEGYLSGILIVSLVCGTSFNSTSVTFWWMMKLDPLHFLYKLVFYVQR